MKFTASAIAALAGIASAQKVSVVTVGSSNGSLIYSPDNIKVSAGDMVQFQFVSGNHTVTQSTFDQPCQPISMFSSNTSGFHSGFQPAAASASTGNIPTYTIQVNNTTPIWVYCAQGKHCEAGMVMVINENTAANSSRSLANFKSGASKATTVVPGSSSSGSSTSGGTTGTTTGGTTGASTTAATGAGSLVKASGALSLVGAAAALLLF